MSNLSLSRDLVKIPQAISSDFDYLTSFFYRARLLRARYCYSKLSVRLSVGPLHFVSKQLRLSELTTKI